MWGKRLLKYGLIYAVTTAAALGITEFAVSKITGTPRLTLKDYKYYLEQRRAKYSPKVHAQIEDFTNFNGKIYAEAIDRYVQDPNEANAYFASYCGMFYYTTIWGGTRYLPTQTTNRFLTDFIEQTRGYHCSLESNKQDRVGYTLIDQCIRNAERRVEMAETIKQFGVRSNQVHQLINNEVAYINSPLFALRKVEIRDGHPGLVNIEWRFYLLLYKTLKMNEEKSFEQLPHALDIAAVVMQQSIEEQYKRGRIDPNLMPDYFRLLHAKEVEDVMRRQKFSEEEIRRALSPRKTETALTDQDLETRINHLLGIQDPNELIRRHLSIGIVSN